MGTGGKKRKKAAIKIWRTQALRKHSVVWLSSETREHLKNCYNCWRPLKQGKMKKLFPDFNGRAVDGLCWLKNILSSLSFSHRQHKDYICLQSCWDTRQKGGNAVVWEEEGEEELQMAGASDSYCYKQGFWTAGLYFGAEVLQSVTTGEQERNESWLWNTATELSSSW